MLTHDARCSCAFVAEQNFFACFARIRGIYKCMMYLKKQGGILRTL